MDFNALYREPVVEVLSEGMELHGPVGSLPADRGRFWVRGQMVKVWQQLGGLQGGTAVLEHPHVIHLGRQQKQHRLALNAITKTFKGNQRRLILLFTTSQSL
eukprot:scaffold60413_cov23-Prasinocladus_malaysianus.AAC.1